MITIRKNTCPHCLKTFSSKQRYDGHIKGRICIPKITTISLNLRHRESDGPKTHIGINIDDIQSFYDMAVEDHLELKMTIDIDHLHLVRLFSTLYHLSDANYGHPLIGTSVINESNNGLGKYDMNAQFNVYKFYNQEGVIIENDPTFDLIKFIYDGLLRCYHMKCSYLISLYYKNDKNRIIHEDASEIAKMQFDNPFSSLLGRKKVKIHVDNHYGDGTYDSLMDDKLLSFDQKKKHFLNLYTSIILQQNKYVNHRENVLDGLELDDLIKINQKIIILENSADQFHLFKSIITTF